MEPDFESSLLGFFGHPSSDLFHGQEGSTSAEDGATNQRPASENTGTSLCAFLRLPTNHTTHVAVSERGDKPGDVRDSERERLEEPTFKRRRGLSAPRLTKQNNKASHGIPQGDEGGLMQNLPNEEVVSVDTPSPKSVGHETRDEDLAEEPKPTDGDEPRSPS